MMTYDAEVDAAYLSLDAEARPDHQHRVTLPGGHELLLDLDGEGRLLGMEILGASALLTAGTLSSSTRIG